MVSRGVSLARVGEAEIATLGNLIELYIHDLSEAFELDVGADGRFGYHWLPLYLSEPEARFAYLMKVGEQLAGFALVTRGSPASADPNDLDVAEFFVLRRYRRLGVGRRAAFLLWDELGGHWVVRVAERNVAGLAFWRRTVDEYSAGDYEVGEHPGKSQLFHVLRFSARRRR